MTIANVDNATLNNLIPNLDISDVADPALRLAAFQYIYAEMQAIINELNSVPTANLQNLSVTAAKLASLAVETGKIADLAVTTAKINDLAVTLAKMAANSVGTTQLVDLSVTQAKIGYGAVGVNQLATGLAASVDVNAQLAKRGIDVTSAPYNAVGDGVTDDTAAIQAAVNSSTTGGVIFFPSGTYKITSTLQTTAANTIFLFQRGATLKIAGAEVSGILISHDNCKVLNGSFDGTGQTSTNISNACGVRLVGVKGCEVSGNTFSNIVGHNIFLSYNGTQGCENCVIDHNRILTPNTNQTYYDTSGIMLGYSGDLYFHLNNVISNNYIHGNDKLFIGIAIIGHAKHNTIEKNTIFNCNAYGITSYCSDYVDLTLLHTIIKGNHVENVGSSILQDKGMGIYLMRSDDSMVEDNKVINANRQNIFTGTLAQGSIGVHASVGVSVERNRIEQSNAGYSVYISQSYDSNVQNNKVKTGSNGIMISECNDITVSENKVELIAGYSIRVIHLGVVPGRTNYIDHGKRINILSNIIRCSTNTSIGIYLQGASGYLLLHCIVAHNQIKHIANNDSLKLEFLSLSTISKNTIYTTGTGTCIVDSGNTTELIFEGNIMNTANAGATGGMMLYGSLLDIKDNYLNGTPTYPYLYNSNIFRNPTKKYYATAAPTTGTWATGDTVYNVAPAAGGYMGWVCTAGGTPGTWKGFGAIQA